MISDVYNGYDCYLIKVSDFANVINEESDT
jgi:hypothetical protein